MIGPRSTIHLQPRVLHDVDGRESEAIAKLSSLLMHNDVLLMRGKSPAMRQGFSLSFLWKGTRGIMRSEYLGSDEIEDMRWVWKECIGLLGFPKKVINAGIMYQPGTCRL